jgi:micrococcal nuclease
VAEFNGTTIETAIDRVVDGDTVAVTIEGKPEKLRLASLDTEESTHGSDKPVTPWGKEAKRRAEAALPAGSAVTLEFAGTEPVEECLQRYRDNYGRLLVWLHSTDGDYQELMIREGFSPYFCKYGYAEFAANHLRYTHAERQAQRDHRGLWDQVAVNGSEQRNYAMLGVWWELRADLIDEYRRLRATDAALLDSRLDYARLRELAADRQHVTVFTELRSHSPVGQRGAVVEIGSRAQPFKLYLPDVEGDAGQDVIRLLDNRYVPRDQDHNRRSYAYVRGELKLFRDEPEMLVTDADQITDRP